VNCRRLQPIRCHHHHQAAQPRSSTRRVKIAYLDPGNHRCRWFQPTNGGNGSALLTEGDRRVPGVTGLGGPPRRPSPSRGPPAPPAILADFVPTSAPARLQPAREVEIVAVQNCFLPTFPREVIEWVENIDDLRALDPSFRFFIFFGSKSRKACGINVGPVSTCPFDKCLYSGPGRGCSKLSKSIHGYETTPAATRRPLAEPHRASKSNRGYGFHVLSPRRTVANGPCVSTHFAFQRPVGGAPNTSSRGKGWRDGSAAYGGNRYIYVVPSSTTAKSTDVELDYLDPNSRSFFFPPPPRRPPFSSDGETQRDRSIRWGCPITYSVR